MSITNERAHKGDAMTTPRLTGAEIVGRAARDWAIGAADVPVKLAALVDAATASYFEGCDCNRCLAYRALIEEAKR